MCMLKGKYNFIMYKYYILCITNEYNFYFYYKYIYIIIIIITFVIYLNYISKGQGPRGFTPLSRNANIANVNKPAFW